MIDIVSAYLDDCKPMARFPPEDTAMYKASLDAGHYYNKIDKERNGTPTLLKDFVFPRPPQVQSIRPLSTSSLYNGTSDSDTQSDSDCRCKPRTRPKRSSPIAIYTSSGSFSTSQQENLSSSSPMTFQTLPSLLPPIGVFWDIENCNVPKGCSAVLVALVIRDSFFEGYREAEFLVVCDVTKEPSKVIQELNDAQVNLIHVPSLHKNAADEKLRQSMRRFADIHGSPAAVVLITGDINFISDVSDLRHRRKIHVILLHQDNTSESLILCANENYNIVRLFESLPPRDSKPTCEPYQLTVYNIPVPNEPARIKSRLKRISDNCGGRVVEVLPTGEATINFTSKDLAQRAQKRMSGADVFGNKISVGAPTRVDKRNGATPTKNGTTTYVHEENHTYLSSSVPQQGVSSHYHSSSSVFTQYNVPPAKQGSWPDRPAVGLQTVVNGQENAISDGIWNQSWSNGAVRKVTNNGQGREKTPENFRPIRKQHQDNDTVLMPPPIPGTNRKPYNNTAQTNQIPVIVGHVAPRRVSPFLGTGVKAEPSTWAVPPSNSSPYSQTSEDDHERFFHPIATTPKVEPIELQVTNLDQSIDTKDMKKILMTVFSEHVMVIHVSVYVQSDGNLAAHVRVPSLADAQFAISQLHRRKVGYKRILIAYANTGGPSPQLIRSQIVSLLVEIPGHRLPLFKFCELFESRYLTSVSVSDMYKMKDVCLITEEKTGRMICLNPDHRNTPSPAFNTSQEFMELPYCTLHVNRPGKGWAEQEIDTLPNVRIGLKVLTFRIHTLVQSHKGCLPLPSLPRCYEAQFHALEVDETGVPLEHLVSCLSNIEIYQGVGCVKYLRWMNTAVDKTEEPVKCVSPPLAMQQGLFSRELVDLLKMSPHCQLLFNRFIPAYHHHFGRQCRVADYGYTKLIDLLEALPHIVQVLGEGNKRVITLSHKAQVRRFTSDLLRVLKAQASKQVLLSEFATTFHRVINRDWDIVDYGVCDIVDMLSDVSQSTVVVSQLGNDVVISIPKREQTPTEVSRTMKFADEIDDAIEGERRVCLTQTESLKVLATQITMMIRSKDNLGMLLADIPVNFKSMYGYPLKAETYGCTSILQLMQLLRETIMVMDSGFCGPLAQLRDPVLMSRQGLKVWRVLMEDCNTLCMSAAQFVHAYWQCHKETFSFDRLADFPDIVQVSLVGGEQIVQLTAIMSFAGDIYHLLFGVNGRLALTSLEHEYSVKYGRVLQSSQYNHMSLDSLLASIDEVAVVEVEAGHKSIVLNQNLRKIGVKMPASKVAAESRLSVPGYPNSYLNGFIGGMSMYEMCPPKPDTPAKGLPIELPTLQSKVVDLMSTQLISPTSSLLAAHKTPAANYIPLNIVAPAASQLPMPTAFASANHMDGKDEIEHILANGEHTYSMLTNGNESKEDSLDLNSSGNSTPTRIRRKKRLAAHFSTPIET